MTTLISLEGDGHEEGSHPERGSRKQSEADAMGDDKQWLCVWWSSALERCDCAPLEALA